MGLLWRTPPGGRSPPRGGPGAGRSLSGVVFPGPLSEKGPECWLGSSPRWCPPSLLPVSLRPCRPRAAGRAWEGCGPGGRMGPVGSGSPGVSVRGQWWQAVTLGSSGQGLRSHGGREGGDGAWTPWTSPAPRPHHETGNRGACAAVAPGSEDSAWPAALRPLTSGPGLGPRRPGGRFGHSFSHGVVRPAQAPFRQGPCGGKLLGDPPAASRLGQPASGPRTLPQAVAAPRDCRVRVCGCLLAGGQGCAPHPEGRLLANGPLGGGGFWP